MGMNYLWDTNTAIYYLQQHFPPSSEKFIDELLINKQPIISVITEIELLCWKSSKEEDLKVLRNFINVALVIEFDQDIKFKTADIRKAHRIKLPDAIIAATANVYQLTLLTRNVSDFDGISGLEIMNPWEK